MNRLAYKRAQKHLKEDEKVALVLVHSNGKCTWEAGEIMGRVHYKFLEILSRGKKFLELFINHYKLYDELFPEKFITINPTVKEYLVLVMGPKRMLPSKAITATQSEIFKNQANRNKMIEFELNKWKTSNSAHEQWIYNLVREFDRWNNYRILPDFLQEPHAFKRRNKKRHINAITRNWVKEPEAFEAYRKKVCVKQIKKIKPEKVGYTILIESFKKNLGFIYPVNTENTEAVAQLTTDRHYIFMNRVDAQNLLAILMPYFSKDQLKPAEGLLFWKEFRELIKKAINFKECEGLNIERPFLEGRTKTGLE